MPKPLHEAAGSWGPVWAMIAEAADALRRSREQGGGEPPAQDAAEVPAR